MGSNQTSKKSGGIIFLIIFLVVFALGFGILGFGMVRSAHRKERICSAEAQGRVTGYRKSRHDHKRMYSPIVEYQVGNQVFANESNVSSNYKPYNEGEYILVSYNPENPAEFYIKGYGTEISYELGVIFLSVSAGIFVILAICAVLGKSKMDKEKKEKIQVRIILSVILLFMFVVFSCVLGPVIAICISAGMGIFALFGLLQNRHEKFRKEN